MNTAMIYHAYQFLVWAEIEKDLITLLEEHTDCYVNAGEKVPDNLVRVLSVCKNLINEAEKI